MSTVPNPICRRCGATLDESRHLRVVDNDVFCAVRDECLARVDKRERSARAIHTSAWSALRQASEIVAAAQARHDEENQQWR